ncbi:MAG: histidine phosphotransferase family protein [Pseudomonadota bacterium]
MTSSTPNLAALIGSRICHDLISPIGAINNGLELLSMAGSTDGPEMELIGQSVNNASARIRFFRIAFGAAGDQLVGKQEVTSVLRDLYGDTRLDVQWLPEEAQPRSVVRLAFLALLCVEAAMPYGGMIEIAEDAGTWHLTGRADKLKRVAEHWDVLTGPSQGDGLQAAQVQFALLPVIAAETGRTLSDRASETEVRISF